MSLLGFKNRDREGEFLFLIEETVSRSWFWTYFKMAVGHSEALLQMLCLV